MRSGYSPGAFLSCLTKVWIFISRREISVSGFAAPDKADVAAFEAGEDLSLPAEAQAVKSIMTSSAAQSVPLASDLMCIVYPFPASPLPLLKISLMV